METNRVRINLKNTQRVTWLWGSNTVHREVVTININDSSDEIKL